MLTVYNVGVQVIPLLLLDTKKGYHFERLVRDDAGSKSIALKSYAEVYS